MDALRLFIALRLPGDVLDGIGDWQARVMAGTDVRLMPRDHLHVTLVFLGDRPPQDVPVISGLMRDAVSDARRPAFRVYRYQETPRVGMLVLREDIVGHDAYVGRANMLTGTLMRTLEARGLYRREYRSWTPHVTVARFRRAPRLDVPAPDLGTFGPTDVGLFRSTPGPSGSVYEELVALPFRD